MAEKLKQIPKSKIVGECLACPNCKLVGICDFECEGCEQYVPAYLVGPKEEVYLASDVEIIDDDTEEDLAQARADLKLKYDKEENW